MIFLFLGRSGELAGPFFIAADHIENVTLTSSLIPALIIATDINTVSVSE